MFTWLKSLFGKAEVKVKAEVSKVENKIEGDYSEIISAIKTKEQAALLASEQRVAELEAKLKAIHAVIVDEVEKPKVQEELATVEGVVEAAAAVV